MSLLRSLFAQCRYFRSSMGRGGGRTEVKDNYAEYMALESQKLLSNHGMDKLQLELSHNVSPIAKLRLTHYNPEEELTLSRRLEKREENALRTRMKDLERSSHQAVFKQARKLEKHQNRLKSLVLNKYPGSRDYVRYVSCEGMPADQTLAGAMREKVTAATSPTEFIQKMKNPGSREYEQTRGMGYAAARQQRAAENHLSNKLLNRPPEHVPSHGVTSGTHSFR